MKSALLTILKTVAAIYLLIAFVIALSVSWAQLFDEERTPSVFGIFAVTLESGDLIDGVKEDDVLIVHRVSDTYRPNLTVGDVVFTAGGNGLDGVRCGRILSESETAENGKLFFVGKDCDCGSFIRVGENIRDDEVTAVWKGAKLRRFAPVHQFLWSFAGYLILVLLPLTLFVVIQTALLIRKIGRKDK